MDRDWLIVALALSGTLGILLTYFLLSGLEKKEKPN